jgi:hypothetical protein
MKHSALAPVTPLIVALALVLTGCAAGSATPTVDNPAQTLAQSKPPVQLTRNEAIGRIPVQSVQSIDDVTDTSIACLSAAEDPDELQRAWHSAFTATIVSGNVFRVDAIAANLVQAHTDEGWQATTGADGSTHLTSPTIDVEILIDPETISDTEATVHFEATGPCVETAGKDSDEVKDLEAESN